MAYFVYNEGAESLLDGSINWASDTIKARLIASSATPNKDDTTLATGYTAIGTDYTLANKTRTKDDTNDRIVYDNTVDALYSAVAGGSTVGWCIIYKDNGGTHVPIAALDIADTPTNGGDITIQFSSDGIFYLQE